MASPTKLRVVTRALLALGVILAAWTCKGGAFDRPLFDPARADEQAHAALVTTKELPGLGWRVVTDDEFSGPASLESGVPACDGPRSLIRDTAKGLIGHAQRGFELASPQFTRIGTTVSVEIFVYGVDAKPGPLVIAFRDLARDGSLKKCLAESRSAGRLISSTDVTPSTKAPAIGAAVAFDRQFTALNGPPLTRRDEIYAWQQSNVVVLLSISSPKEVFSVDLAKAAIKAVQDDILKASKLK